MFKIICLCWVLGAIVGFLPLMGWNKGIPPDFSCEFTRVMDYNYLVFLYFATIVFPAIVMALFYGHIYSVVLKQQRQMERINGTDACERPLRVGVVRKRDIKAAKNLAIIVLFFVMCWFPLYTINFVHAFCPDCEVPTIIIDICIILSHLNSACNPFVYAYSLTDFRAALKSLITRTPILPNIYSVRYPTPKPDHRIFDVETSNLKNNDDSMLTTLSKDTDKPPAQFD